MSLQKNLSKRELLKATIICTFLWGFVAHGFAFANLNLSHDSLNEFYLFDTAEWKIQLGRYAWPVLRLAMGEYVTLPWLSGIISLLLVFGAAYFTLKIFDLSSLFDVAILTGIYVTNVTITACIASYSEDLAGDMAALFFSVCTVVLWKKSCESFSFYLFGSSIVTTVISLAFYQSYFSVSVLLIMIYSIIQLLNKEKACSVFKKGVYGIIILAAGFALYLLSVDFVCGITGVQLHKDGYNSISNVWISDGSIGLKVFQAYANVIWTFLAPTYASISKNALSNLPTVFHPTPDTFWIFLRTFANWCLFIIAVMIIVKSIAKRKLGGFEIVLSLLLVALLPLAMDISYVGSGTTHDIMRFSYCLFYLFAGLLIKQEANTAPQKKQKTARIVSAIAVAMASIVLLYNIETSNFVYVKKEIEGKATLSTMTRVLDRIEEQDSYVYGETLIAFIGTPSVQKRVPGTETIAGITGVKENTPITHQETYRRYFDNILQYEIHVCDRNQIIELCNNDIVKSMPVFPNRGSIQTIDGVIVAKMSEIE